jgi:two-component system sensor histidine kinase/response regulator
MVLRSLLEEAEAGNGTAAVSRSVLQRMIQSHDRQLALINSLLETHANDVGDISLHLQSVNLQPLVEQVAADWQPLLQKDNATLQILMPPHLPPLRADPNQLCRVYENLIANALKHNPPGLTLSLTADLLPTSADGSVQDHPIAMVRCSVIDDGVGIPPEQVATMFELYQRGEQSRRTVGLGLGLYLCRQIITAHGGTICVSSQPGNGSNFWFTLPVVDTHSTEKSIAPLPEP